MYGQAYRRKRLSRTDWMVIGVYWLIVLPLIYLTNIHVYELETVLEGMAFTFILDSALVLTVLYILPSLFTNKKYAAILMLSATILVFGLVYMIGYNSLYKGEYKITPGSWAGGVLQHVRSYGLLLIFASVRKFYTLQLQSEREKLEAQIAQLKSRVSPHFLLNALYAFHGNGKDRHLRERFIEDFSAVLHYTLYDCQEDYIDLEDEIAFLKNYLSLEKLQLWDPSCIEASFSGSFEGYIVPGILIQFIENAFKHGHKTKEEPVKLSFVVRDCMLYFSIENTYREKTKSREVGIGLENARKTLDLQYQDSYELLIENTFPVFSVQLILPLYEQQNKMSDSRRSAYAR